MTAEQYTQLADLVEKANADTTVSVEHIGINIESVRFDIDDGEFGWIAKRSWANSGSVGYVHPMKNSNYVKTFKTLAGAKRNFLNYWRTE